MADIVEDLSKQTAIAHLKMLEQYATGEIKPKSKADPSVRYNAVLSYLVTGKCVPDAELKPVVEAVRSALDEQMAAAA